MGTLRKWQYLRRAAETAGGVTRTVRDTTTDEAGEGEHAVKDTVRRVGEREVLGASRTKVTDGAEHAHCRETGCASVWCAHTGGGHGKSGVEHMDDGEFDACAHPCTTEQVDASVTGRRTHPPRLAMPAWRDQDSPGYAHQHDLCHGRPGHSECVSTCPLQHRRGTYV